MIPDKELPMPGRYLASATLCLLAVLPGSAASQAQEPVLVVTVRSGDDLLSAFRYFASLTGQKARVKEVDDFLKTAAGGKGLGSVFHMNRPLGLYALWSARGKGLDHPVFVLPVADDKAVLPLLRRHLLVPVSVGDGVYRVSSLQFSTWYLRLASGHLYLAHDAGLIRGKLPAPAAVLSPPADNALLSATLHVPRIPEKALAALQRELEQALVSDNRKEAGESPAGYRLRMAENEHRRKLCKGLLRENQALTLSVQLDPKRRDLRADLTLKPVPGSSLAQEIQRLGDCTGFFHDLGGPNVLGRISLSLHLPKALSFKSDLENLRQLVVQTVSPAGKTVMRNLLRALGPTLSSEELDVGVALVRSEEVGYGFIAGFKIYHARRLEHALRDGLKNMSRFERTLYGVTWNHFRHEGIRIHSTSAPAQGDERVFVYFALHKDVLLVSNDRKLLTQALDDHGKARRTRKSAAEVTMDLDFVRSIPVISEAPSRLENYGRPLLAWMFPGQDVADFKVALRMGALRLQLDGGSNLRLRLELSIRPLRSPASPKKR
jgi:hypothetical protein